MKNVTNSLVKLAANFDKISSQLADAPTSVIHIAKISAEALLVSMQVVNDSEVWDVYVANEIHSIYPVRLTGETATKLLESIERLGSLRTAALFADEWDENLTITDEYLSHEYEPMDSFDDQNEEDIRFPRVGSVPVPIGDCLRWIYPHRRVVIRVTVCDDWKLME